MITLGTPYIGLFNDGETSLLFACILLGYSTLYFYLKSRELKKQLQQLQAVMDDNNKDYSSEGLAEIQ